MSCIYKEGNHWHSISLGDFHHAQRKHCTREQALPTLQLPVPGDCLSGFCLCVCAPSGHILQTESYDAWPFQSPIRKMKKKKKRGTYKVILKVKHTAYQVLKHIIITDYPHAPTCQASFIQPVFSRFVPIVTCVRTSSPFMAKWCSVVWLDEILFIHSPTDGHF